MNKLYRFRIFLTVLMFTLAVIYPIRKGHTVEQSVNTHFEAISDVDLSFLLTNPKLPWGEDPFRKMPGVIAAPSEPEEPAYTLGGVIYQKNDPVAMVNGKLVRPGDRVGSRTVASIGANYVILKRKSSEIELTLPAQSPDEGEAEHGEDEDENE